jgi:hypothetical protein
MTAIQKQITVTDVAFDQLDDRAMTAKATLRIGNVTYSYLTIDAVLSDDLRDHRLQGLRQRPVVREDELVFQYEVGKTYEHKAGRRQHVRQRLPQLRRSARCSQLLRHNLFAVRDRQGRRHDHAQG